MSKTDLVLDLVALDKMGIKGETIYVIEYDLNSPLKIKAYLNAEQKKQARKRNKMAKDFRNRLDYILHFILKATKHLESAWLIDGKRLERAVELLEGLKSEMKAKGFKDVDKRIKIVPILTTLEGFQHYDDKKSDFLLEFAMEHIRYLENGIKDRRIADSTIWRCKKAYEHIEALKEELKNHASYNELVDTNQSLGDLVCQMEAIILEEKKKED